MRIVWALFCVLALVTAFGPIRYLKFPPKVRILLGFFAFASAQGYVLQKLFDVPVMCPDGLPFPLLVLAKWGDIATLLAGLLSLIWITLRLCGVKWAPWQPLTGAMVLGALMLWLGVRMPPVHERSLVVRDLPAAAEGLRVAVVADLHIDCWRGRAWCEAFVERLNAARPDVVLFTGDQVDGEIAKRLEDLAPLAKLQAPYGKYLISGNHEWMFGGDDYMAHYASLGLTVLDGKRIEVQGLTLIGLPDTRSLTNAETLPLLMMLMADMPKEACTILMAHKPGIAPDADLLGVDVQFSGHTHGGQLPGLATLMKRFNKGFVRGFYDLPEGMKLFVAPGSAAWIGFPYRLFYTSELTLFTLTR
jgi:predicted MPP superfamily phosphohydrolase